MLRHVVYDGDSQYQYVALALQFKNLMIDKSCKQKCQVLLLWCDDDGNLIFTIEVKQKLKSQLNQSLLALV